MFYLVTLYIHICKLLLCLFFFLYDVVKICLRNQAGVMNKSYFDVFRRTYLNKLIQRRISALNINTVHTAP